MIYKIIAAVQKHSKRVSDPHSATDTLSHTHTHTHTHTESDFVNLLLKSHRRGENEKPFILVTMYFQNSLHTGFVDIFRIKRTSFLKKHHPEKA